MGRYQMMNDVFKRMFLSLKLSCSISSLLNYRSFHEKIYPNQGCRELAKIERVNNFLEKFLKLSSKENKIFDYWGSPSSPLAITLH